MDASPLHLKVRCQPLLELETVKIYRLRLKLLLLVLRQQLGPASFLTAAPSLFALRQTGRHDDARELICQCQRLLELLLKMQLSRMRKRLLRLSANDSLRGIALEHRGSGGSSTSGRADVRG